MSDEPVEDGDSGSDAEGASSSSGSDKRDDRSPADDGTEDQPREGGAADDGVDADNGGDAGDGEDAGDEGDTDDGGVDDSVESVPADVDADEESSETAPDGESSATGPDEDGDVDATFVGDDFDGTVPDGASDDETTDSNAGRPGYTDDHVTASNDADDADADATAEGADSDDRADATAPEDGTDPADHAPIGTQAPSPDEGPTTSVTDPDAAGAGAGGGSGGGGGGGSSILSGGIGGTAPPDDEEMPLTEHIEEMLTRLAIVVVVASLATLAAFPFANDIIIQMWYDVHNGSVAACQPAPQSESCVAPHVYGPLELVLTRIRVAGLAGLLVALPLAVYQIYRFMRPGLYPHERRYYLAAVPFSLLLGIVGMTFAYFVLLPLLFEYFITYTEGSADLAFQLAETMNLILLMMGMLAIIFQIPLLIMLAIMMGITTRRWLERRRLYFWGLFLGVAVIFGPDPTGMAPFLLTATMVALFEGTLLLLRWTGR